MGRVTGLTITDSGTQYSTIPTVTISLPDQDSSNAAATAIINQDGNVTGFSITDSGTYYTSVPSITIALPDEDSANATASVSISDSGYIDNITLDNAGRYYTSTPTITISAPDGKPANWVTSYSGVNAKWGNYSYKLDYRYDDSDYKNFSNVNQYGSIETTNVSLEFWINIPASRTGDIMLFPINHDTDGSQNKVRVEGQNIKWIWTESSGGSSASIQSSGNQLTPQTWHFVQLVRDYNSGTTDHKLYINGVIADYTDNRPNVSALIEDKIRLVNSIGSDGILLDAIRFNFNDNVISPSPDSDRNPYDDTSDSATNYLGFHLVTATATATVVNGSLDAVVEITNAGNGFYKTATATIDSATGTKADFRATATATLTNGALSAINLTDSGGFYSVAPVVTIDSATGNKSSFRATARAKIDSDAGEISQLIITDSGNFYVNAPTVTIDDPTDEADFIRGEKAEMTLSSGVKISGEVLKWSDSDNVLHLGHVGADDGKYHTFATNTRITGQTSTATGIVLSLTEDNQISSNEQNEYFDTLVDFLDFSESNPFGDPS